MKDLFSLQERMNRLFEDSLLRSQAGEEDLTLGAWTPAVDIYEQPERIVLRADLPGVQPDQIQLKVENNMLTLSGERHFEKNVRKENYHRIERQYGSFVRSFSLPSSVDAEKIQADHRDGVLEITLPKTETSKPKAIKIDVR
jgi:HSP20 family protein